jgi:hypothetical protein
MTTMNEYLVELDNQWDRTGGVVSRLMQQNVNISGLDLDVIARTVMDIAGDLLDANLKWQSEKDPSLLLQVLVGEQDDNKTKKANRFHQLLDLLTASTGLNGGRFTLCPLGIVDRISFATHEDSSTCETHGAAPVSGVEAGGAGPNQASSGLASHSTGRVTCVRCGRVAAEDAMKTLGPTYWTCRDENACWDRELAIKQQETTP